MSSSGHGQSVVRSADAIDAAWTEAQEGRRAADEGDVSRVIVEALAPLERELTVLTVSSSAGIVNVRADRPTSGVRRLPRVLAAGYRTRW